MNELNPFILAYGESGTNKTGLIDTVSNALIVSSSPAIIRLQHKKDKRVVYVDSIDSLETVIDSLGEPNALDYDWHCFDSLTQIAEAALLSGGSTDRKAYMLVQNRLMRCLLKLTATRNRPTYCTAWEKPVVTQDGEQRSFPSFPGVALVGKIPHLFTNIMHMHIAEDGESIAARTRKTPTVYGKDESGNLAALITNPDLSEILSQIRGEENV
tara:strand:+ start:3482 stop:4120 length:639 start_codon:yes stop_codon:yes gene_type:complete